MKHSLENIVADLHVGTIAALAHELAVKAYLAGGGVRDLLLGRRLKDLDFALTGMAAEFPRRFAERIGGSFFWLDRERLQSRVAGRTPDGPLTFDFAPLRGEGIEEDLSLRDFTVNAMALELGGRHRLIDPLHGADDLRKGVIRGCSATSFEDDPLRLLRAIRLAATLGFVIEEGTWDDIGKYGELLARVAAERIRDEFFQILAAPQVGASLKRLCDSGLMARLVPAPLRGKVAEADLAGGIAGAVRVEEVADRLEQAFPGHCRQLAAHLGREVEGGVSSLSLLKLAALIGAGGRPGAAYAWVAGLRLGKKAARMLALLASDTGFAARSVEPARRAMFRFFRDHEPAGVELAVQALAREELSRALSAELIRYFFEDYPHEEEFLSGDEIMETLGIGRGRVVGEALERLKDAERRGVVNSREEARAFLVKNLLTRSGSMS